MDIHTITSVNFQMLCVTLGLQIVGTTVYKLLMLDPARMAHSVRTTAQQSITQSVGLMVKHMETFANLNWPDVEELMLVLHTMASVKLNNVKNLVLDKLAPEFVDQIIEFTVATVK